MRTNLLAWVAVLLTAGSFATQAVAQPVCEDNEVAVAANYSHPVGNDENYFNADASYGYFLTDQVELGVRQGYALSEREDEDGVWFATTAPFLDYHFTSSRSDSKIVPFLGGFIGGVWNDKDGTGVIGPDAGIKFYLHPTTSLMARYHYSWLFKDDFDTGRRGVNDDDNDTQEAHIVTVGLTYAWGCNREAMDTRKAQATTTKDRAF